MKLKNANQLDATYCFIILMIGSTCFGPSSGAHDYSADYHMVRPVLGLLLVGSEVQAGWISVRAAGHSTTILSGLQAMARL